MHALSCCWEIMLFYGDPSVVEEWSLMFLEVDSPLLLKKLVRLHFWSDSHRGDVVTVELCCFPIVRLFVWCTAAWAGWLFLLLSYVYLGLIRGLVVARCACSSSHGGRVLQMHLCPHHGTSRKQCAQFLCTVFVVCCSEFWVVLLGTYHRCILLELLNVVSALVSVPPAFMVDGGFVVFTSLTVSCVLVHIRYLPLTRWR